MSSYLYREGTAVNKVDFPFQCDIARVSEVKKVLKRVLDGNPSDYRILVDRFGFDDGWLKGVKKGKIQFMDDYFTFKMSYLLSDLERLEKAIALGYPLTEININYYEV